MGPAIKAGLVSGRGVVEFSRHVGCDLVVMFSQALDNDICRCKSCPRYHWRRRMPRRYHKARVTRPMPDGFKNDANKLGIWQLMQKYSAGQVAIHRWMGELELQAVKKPGPGER